MNGCETMINRCNTKTADVETEEKSLFTTVLVCVRECNDVKRMCTVCTEGRADLRPELGYFESGSSCPIFTSQISRLEPIALFEEGKIMLITMTSNALGTLKPVLCGAGPLRKLFRNIHGHRSNTEEVQDGFRHRLIGSQILKTRREFRHSRFDFLNSIPCLVAMSILSGPVSLLLQNLA